jgi:hypothetical protein
MIILKIKISEEKVYLQNMLKYHDGEHWIIESKKNVIRRLITDNKDKLDEFIDDQIDKYEQIKENENKKIENNPSEEKNDDRKEEINNDDNQKEIQTINKNKKQYLIPYKVITRYEKETDKLDEVLNQDFRDRKPREESIEAYKEVEEELNMLLETQRIINKEEQLKLKEEDKNQKKLKKIKKLD